VTAVGDHGRGYLAAGTLLLCLAVPSLLGCTNKSAQVGVYFECDATERIYIASSDTFSGYPAISYGLDKRDSHLFISGPRRFASYQRCWVAVDGQKLASRYSDEVVEPDGERPANVETRFNDVLAGSIVCFDKPDVYAGARTPLEWPSTASPSFDVSFWEYPSGGRLSIMLWQDAPSGMTVWQDFRDCDAHGALIDEAREMAREDVIELAKTPSPTPTSVPPVVPTATLAPLVGSLPGPLPLAASVSAGATHSCGVTEQGEVLCWGSNLNGESEPPGGVFAAVSAGDLFSCGLRRTGEVVCWGLPIIRDDEPVNPLGFTFVGAQPRSPAIAIETGSEFACALLSDHSVTCWGSDSERVPNRWSPERPGFFRSISAGEEHVCGIRDNGEVTCWGSNWSGQSEAPQEPLMAISAGANHTCALGPGRDVVCWGRNFSGQLDAPAGSFTAVAASASATCAISEDQTVVCWGGDDEIVAPSGRFVQISGGRDHFCGLTVAGTVECWGSNGDGDYYGATDAPRIPFASSPSAPS